MTHVTEIRTYRTIVRAGELTNGQPCVVAEHPDIPGCTVYGATEAEARSLLDEARKVIIRNMTAANEKIPAPSVSKVLWNNEPAVEVPAARYDVHPPMVAAGGF